MHRLFTTAELVGGGMTEAALEWAQRTGRLRRVIRGVYRDGAGEPSDLDRHLAVIVRAGSVARGRLAAVLHGLDGVELGARPRRRAALPDGRVIDLDGVRCADGFQTLLDLAAEVDDLVWEQALESALRMKLTLVPALESALAALGRSRAPGTARIRRVLALRPEGAPPTESLLETLMVQLARDVERLGDPVRQHEVFDPAGRFVARVDLCWPEIGLFVELDGQHHQGQPVHDARRETAVIAATGWLPGRFTWREVATLRRTTARRLADLADQARLRPVARLS